MNPETAKRLKIGGSVLLIVVMALFVLPTPTAFASHPENVPQLVKLEMLASRTIIHQHALKIDAVDAKPQTVLDWSPFINGAPGFSLRDVFSTRDYTASVTLEAATYTLGTVEKKVGDFPRFGSGSNDFTVAFRDVPPGTYTINAALIDADGATKATLREEIVIVAR